MVSGVERSSGHLWRPAVSCDCSRQRCPCLCAPENRCRPRACQACSAPPSTWRLWAGFLTGTTATTALMSRHASRGEWCDMARCGVQLSAADGATPSMCVADPGRFMCRNGQRSKCPVSFMCPDAGMSLPQRCNVSPLIANSGSLLLAQSSECLAPMALLVLPGGSHAGQQLLLPRQHRAGGVRQRHHLWRPVPASIPCTPWIHGMDAPAPQQCWRWGLFHGSQYALWSLVHCGQLRGLACMTFLCVFVNMRTVR